SPPARPSSTLADDVVKPPDKRISPDSFDPLNILLRWTADDWNALNGLADTTQLRRVFDGIYKVIGLLVTALALTMGAEFWYNILKKLVPTLPGQNADEPGRP